MTFSLEEKKASKIGEPDCNKKKLQEKGKNDKKELIDKTVSYMGQVIDSPDPKGGNSYETTRE